MIDEIGEVDHHVLEQLGCCTRERTRGPGTPTLMPTGMPSSSHTWYDGVVPRVVDGDLRGERHHPHQREPRVLGQLADALHVARRAEPVAEPAATRKRPGWASATSSIASAPRSRPA